MFFNFFYLVKINKLIFFNLNADMTFFIIILTVTSGQQCKPFVSCAIFVSDVTVGTKTKGVFQDRD